MRASTQPFATFTALRAESLSAEENFSVLDQVQKVQRLLEAHAFFD
jgi:hypothetical protein